MIGEVPGLKTIATSLVSGSVNALVTLRIGYVTRLCLLDTGMQMDKSTLRKSAAKEARAAMPSVGKEAAKKMPGAISKFVSSIFN